MRDWLLLVTQRPEEGYSRGRSIFVMTISVCCWNWLGTLQDQRFVCVFLEVCSSYFLHLHEQPAYRDIFCLLTHMFLRRTQFQHQSISISEANIKRFFRTCEGTWSAEESFHRNYDTSFGLPLLLPICIPESMFCFCFQSPSLKLQALEADLGPAPAQEDTQVQDNLPFSSHDQSLYFNQKLPLHSPPSSPAQDQHTVDSSQPGKIMVLMHRNNIKIFEFLMLNIFLENCIIQSTKETRETRNRCFFIYISFLLYFFQQTGQIPVRKTD